MEPTIDFESLAIKAEQLRTMATEYERATSNDVKSIIISYNDISIHYMPTGPYKQAFETIITPLVALIREEAADYQKLADDAAANQQSLIGEEIK